MAFDVTQANRSPWLVNTILLLSLNQPINFQLAATGPEGPFDWLSNGSSLLVGLQLSSSGYLTGTPTALTTSDRLPVQDRVSDGQLSNTATVTLKVVETIYNAMGTLTLNQVAPSDGLVLTLASSDNSKATVP